ncbi:MAG: hypothetical protein Kow0069_03500 [Promethearchaeota archaeon]
MISYALKQFRRNGKRVGVLLVGAVLSLALFSGVNVATDSIRAYSLSEALEEVRVDFAVGLSTRDWKGAEDRLLEQVVPRWPFVDDVATTGSWSTIRGFNVTKSPAGVNWTRFQLEGFNSTHYFSVGFAGVNLSKFFSNGRFSELVDLQSGKPPASAAQEGEHGVYVTKDLAEYANLSVGDSFFLGALHQEVNQTSGLLTNYTAQFGPMKVLGVFSLADLGDDGVRPLYDFDIGGWHDPWRDVLFPRVSFSPRAILCGLETVEAAFDALWHDYDYAGEGGAGDGTNGFEGVDGAIWYPYYGDELAFQANLLVDHAKLNVADSGALGEELARVEAAAVSAVGPTNVSSVENYLTVVLKSHEVVLAAFRTVMVTASLPVLLLGGFLVNTLFQATLDARRVEVGRLRARGASRRQVLVVLLVETAGVGALAGALGLGAGYLASGALLRTFLGPGYAEFVGSNPTSVSGLTAGLSVSVGAGFAVVGAYRPISRFAGLPVARHLEKYHGVESRQVARSRREWLALAGGLLPVLSLFVDFRDFDIGGNPLVYLVVVLWPVLLPLAVLSPFLLSYALTKILAGRGVPKLAKLTGWASTRLSGKAGYLAGRNLKRNPLRAYRLAFLVGMTLSFGVAGACVYQSQLAFETDQVNLEYGADFLLYDAYPTLNTSFVERIRNEVPGVAGTAQVALLYGQLQGYSDDWYFSQQMWVAALNSSDYSRVASLSRRYFSEEPSSAFQRLRSVANACLVESRWSERTGLGRGDSFAIAVTSGGHEAVYAMTIVGVVQFFPGVSQYAGAPTVVVEASTVNDTFLSDHSDLNYYQHLTLVDVDYGALDPSEVPTRETIEETFPDAVTGVKSRAEAMEDLWDPQRRVERLSPLDLLSVEFYFLLLVATAGVAILFYWTVAERRRELALWRARGASSKVLVRVLLSEGVVVLAVGTLVGLVGFLAAWVNNHLLDVMTSYYNLERPFVVPWGVVAGQLLGSFAAFLAVMYAAARWETRWGSVGRLPEVLRVD